MILDAIGEKGQIKRKYYQRVLPEDPTKDYYYIMRETPDTTALLIEYGFIDNANDRKKLQNNLLDYVEGVVEAVANYIGVEYTEPGQTQPGNNLYTVKKGDTLYSIANRFNTTVQALKTLNNLTSDTLTIGQTLKIPTGEENTQTTYTVKSGDTLYSIANRFNTTVQALKTLNNLTSNTLTIGQILKIPTTDNNLPEESTDEYTVQSGDSLYSIAQKFNTTVNDLIEYNQLATTIIQPGQVLKIPKVTSTNIVYTVKKGDTLYSIANNYGVSVDAIKKLNNLTSNTLSIGQQLYIPKDSVVEETDFVVYEVKPGDTLYSIAKKYNTTPEAIKNYNNLTSNLLTINQVLQIPVEGVSTENVIYTVKKDSRVIDVIRLAGDLTDNADTSVLNLSKKVTDEMVIIIYSYDEVANFALTKEKEKQEQEACLNYSEITNDACIKDESEIVSDSTISLKISLNTATIEELMTLPGIGEAKAKAIISYREEVGAFQNIEELKEVDGIGDTLFDQIKENITI